MNAYKMEKYQVKITENVRNHLGHLNCTLPNLTHLPDREMVLAAEVAKAADGGLRLRGLVLGNSCPSGSRCPTVLVRPSSNLDP